jgi:hypothetical protein
VHLVNSFEEEFRPLDPCSGDFMNELNVELASKLSQCVVSLAAFNGAYACLNTIRTSARYYFLRLK